MKKCNLEKSLSKLKGYNNLRFLSKTKHKGMFFLFSFYIPFCVIVHLYDHSYRQLLLHYFITYSTLRDAESKLGLRLLIYPIVYGHSHRKSYHRYVLIYLSIGIPATYIQYFLKGGCKRCKHALSMA